MDLKAHLLSLGCDIFNNDALGKEGVLDLAGDDWLHWLCQGCQCLLCQPKDLRVRRERVVPLQEIECVTAQPQIIVSLAITRGLTAVIKYSLPTYWTCLQ
jgi:hypothetical protein